MVRHAEWRGAELAAFTRDHVEIVDGAARISAAGGLDGTDTGNLYHGGEYTYGTLVSPEIEVEAPFVEAIASWEATTPANTWIEVAIAARIGTRWTKDYVLGIWSSGNEAFDRHSVDGQDDADGAVLTDTLVLTAPADAFRIKSTLFATGASGTPRLRALHAVVTDPEATAPALDAFEDAHGAEVAVPGRSQMIYEGGGEIWCSPTSTVMVLAHWAAETSEPWVVDVPDAADATYDPVFGGTGNWPFNTAWAASVGTSTSGEGLLRAFVTRMWRVEQLERLTAAGIPVVVSASWSSGGMTGAPLDSSGGHLFVVTGFDADGDVVVADPAGPEDDGVRYVYDRAQFDAAWSNSGRTTYVIHPLDIEIPAEGALGAW